MRSRCICTANELDLVDLGGFDLGVASINFALFKYCAAFFIAFRILQATTKMSNLPTKKSRHEVEQEKAKMTATLSERQQEFSRELENLKHLHAELHCKKEEYACSLPIANERLRDNQSKRLHAIKKLELEEQKFRRMEQELNGYLDVILTVRLKKQYCKAVFVKGKIDRRLRYFGQFHKYLTAVVQLSDKFTEITDLISRAEALRSLKSVCF